MTTALTPTPTVSSTGSAIPAAAITPTAVQMSPTTATTSTSEPPTGNNPDSGLDAGDVIAGLALVVAILAAWFAYRAARANEDMVRVQEDANRLHADEIALMKQHRQEDQDAAAATAAGEISARHAASARAASQVAVRYVPNGGVDVDITNESSWPVDRVRLVHLQGEHPDWSWRPNPNIPVGNSPTKLRLAPGDTKTVACVFFDETDTMHRMDGDAYESRVRFTDRDGQRWEVGTGDNPRQVAAGDEDIV